MGSESREWPQVGSESQERPQVGSESWSGPRWGLRAGSGLRWGPQLGDGCCLPELDPTWGSQAAAFCRVVWGCRIQSDEDITKWETEGCSHTLRRKRWLRSPGYPAGGG